MTWIKTVSMDEDPRVRAAMEAQRRRFTRRSTRTPVPSVDRGVEAGITSSALADSRRALSFVQRVRRDDVAGVAIEASPARNDCDDGFASRTGATIDRIARQEFLRRVTLDESMVDALKRDYSTAPISEQTA